jgi:hypothetical protein
VCEHCVRAGRCPLYPQKADIGRVRLNVRFVARSGHWRIFDLAQMDSGLGQLLNGENGGWV